MIDANTAEDDKGTVVVSNVKCDDCSSGEKLSVVESKVESSLIENGESSDKSSSNDTKVVDKEAVVDDKGSVVVLPIVKNCSQCSAGEKLSVVEIFPENE